MSRITLPLLIITLLSLLITHISSLQINTITRTISLQTQIPREDISITVHNDESNAVVSFNLGALANFETAGSYLSRVTAKVNHHTAEVHITSSPHPTISIHFPEPIPVKGNAQLDISLVYLNRLVPKPHKIKQSENQKVTFETPAILSFPDASNTPIESQSVTFILASSVVESFTKEVRGVAAKRRGNQISYGPFHKISAHEKILDTDKISLHFQNNYPFLRIEKLTRLIEVSMWGNLAVEEQYVLKHAGAELDGGFSRLDYTRGNPSVTAPASFRSLTAKLPSINAFDVFYRDRIGNVSTSTCAPSSDKRSLEVEIQPRYPMMGGWKSTFILGYNVPLNEFLQRDGSKYVLNYTFGTSFPEAPVDDYELKILIPEGSKNIRLEVDPSVRVPHPLKERIEVFKTYLDTTGRPMLIATKKAVSPELNKDTFALHFEFSRTSVLHEPLLVIGALFAICIITMIYVRFDVKIAKTPTRIKRDQQSRAHELTEQYVALQLERDQLYERLEKAFSSMRRTNKASQFDHEMEQVEKKRATIAQRVTSIQEQLRAFKCVDVLAKIAAIEQKEDEKMGKISSLNTMQKRAIESKDKKVNEAEIEKLERQYDTCTEEINSALETLM